MPTEHVIQQGETIASLALQYGFFPDTIWNDSANAELKRSRQDPHVLLPGDLVTVLDKRLKEVAKPDKARHRFRRRARLAAGHVDGTGACDDALWLAWARSPTGRRDP